MNRLLTLTIGLLNIVFPAMSIAQFDPAFGTVGHVVAGFPPTIARAGNNTAVGLNGEVYLTGKARDPDTGSLTAILIAKFAVDGTPDAVFGSGGKVSLPITPTGNLLLFAALDSSEHLIVVAQTLAELTITRLLGNGAPDPAFGTGGIVSLGNPYPLISPSYGVNPILRGITIDENNRIILLTTFTSALPPEGWDALVARITSTGAIDVSFGVNGFRLLAFGNKYLDQGEVLLYAPGNGIYVAMESGPASGGAPIYWDALVVKIDVQGNPDLAFGVAGVSQLPAITGEKKLVVGLTADSLGRVYTLIDDVVYSPYSRRFYVARLDPSGVLDTSFGAQGTLAVPSRPSNDFTHYVALALDADENLLLQFEDSPYATPVRAGLARMSQAGELDQGFGTGGVLLDTQGSYNQGTNPLRVDAQHRVIVGSTLYSAANNTDLQAFRLAFGSFARIDIGSSATFARQGQVVTISATPSIAGLKGKMLFQSDGQPIAGCGSISLIGGAATCASSAFAVGVHAITARYVNDPGYPDYHSPSIQQFIMPPGIALDADGDGASDALTDGLLVIRYLFGVRDATLVSGVLSGGATRTEGGTIAAYLAGLNALLDIDGDGRVDALTDGLLVVRYLFGLRGSGLVAGAVAPAAQRKAPADIEAYLAELVH